MFHRIKIKDLVPYDLMVSHFFTKVTCSCVFFTFQLLPVLTASAVRFARISIVCLCRFQLDSPSLPLYFNSNSKVTCNFNQPLLISITDTQSFGKTLVNENLSSYCLHIIFLLDSIFISCHFLPAYQVPKHDFHVA